MLINEDKILKIAQEKLENRSFINIFIIQGLTEWEFLAKKRMNFRRRENRKAVQAYVKMGIREFEGINARQSWSNWRTLPRNLSGRIPDQPISVLDLCCGTGQSTEVLSCYLPYGSKILGLEFNPTFVERARKRIYFHESGKPCDVAFRVQSVLEPFHDEKGKRVPDRSIDLANSCGAVGFHFDRDAIQILAKEIARVVKPGGFATIDVGFPGSGRKRIKNIFESSGFKLVGSATSCFLDPRKQYCFEKR